MFSQSYGFISCPRGWTHTSKHTNDCTESIIKNQACASLLLACTWFNNMLLSGVLRMLSSFVQWIPYNLEGKNFGKRVYTKNCLTVFWWISNISKLPKIILVCWFLLSNGNHRVLPWHMVKMKHFTIHR